MEKLYNQSSLVRDFPKLTKKILGVELSVTRDTMIRWVACGHIKPSQSMSFGKNGKIVGYSYENVEDFIKRIPSLEEQLILRVRRVHKNVKTSKRNSRGKKQWDKYEK